MKLILPTAPPTTDDRVKVVGEISATNYKRLCSTLRDLPKRDLWEVLDHWLFHCITDADVDALLAGLKKMQEEEVPIAASTLETLAGALGKEAPSSLEQPQVRNLESFKNPIEKKPPSDGELDASRHLVDLIYDETYFKRLAPDTRPVAAKKLISFSEKNDLPVADHWTAYAATPMLQ